MQSRCAKKATRGRVHTRKALRANLMRLICFAKLSECDASSHRFLSHYSGALREYPAAFTNRFGVADRDDRDGPVRAFQQASEDVAGAELNE